MNLSIIQISSDLELPRYKFIVWDSDKESNIQLSNTGIWVDWSLFCRQAKVYYTQIEEEYKSYYPDEDDYEASEFKLAHELVSLTRSKPYFVERSEKIKKRREKGPIGRLVSKFSEDYMPTLSGFAVLAFFLYLLGQGIWIFVAPSLDRWGVIEYETKGDRRYAKFLDTVSDCQLRDELRSPEKTDKWPRYAVYSCPDGSRKTWRYKVKVVTESKGKLIVE